MIDPRDGDAAAWAPAHVRLGGADRKLRLGGRVARQLTFSLGASEFPTNPGKVDRSALYGRTETIALDAAGRECELVLVDRSGTLVIPKGGTGMGSLSAAGHWVERSSLSYRSEGGDPLTNQPSSYDAPIKLDTLATPQELLDVAVSAIYLLSDDPAFVEALGKSIYRFEYYFRAGPTGSLAFVLASGEAAFMLLGQPNSFPLVGLETAVEELDLETEEDDDFDLDFSMM